MSTGPTVDLKISGDIHWPDLGEDDLDCPLLAQCSKVEAGRAGRVKVHFTGVFRDFQIIRNCRSGREPKIGDRYLIVLRPDGSEGGLLGQDQALELVRSTSQRWYRRACVYIALAWGGGLALGAALVIIARHLGVFHG